VVNELELVRSSSLPRLSALYTRLQLAATRSAFPLAFLGALGVAFLLQGPKPFYGDSGDYWALASTFTHGGGFSLLSFESPVRGYALPLFLHLLRVGEHAGWTQSSLAKLFNAVVFALIGSVLAPRLAQVVWPAQRWGVWRRLALTALLLVFWSGDLSYPLSDFLGLALALAALVAIARPDRPAWMLAAGAAVGAAIDMRPAYLAFAPGLLLVLALTWREQHGTRRASNARRALCVGLLILGFAAASLPQSLASHRHYGTWSFIPGGPAHLTQEQLTSSIYLQRYDTFVAPPSTGYPVRYIIPAGVEILREREGRFIAGVGEYLEVLAEHPAFTASMVARHIVNGLDMRYSTAYVEHLDSGGKTWLRLAGFVLVFLASARVLWPLARRSLGRARWRYALALLMCSATSVFSAIETRFMLPVWTLIYLLVLAPGWPNPREGDAAGWRRYRVSAILTIAGTAFVVGAWSLVAGVTGRVVPI
jgi:hypothetical protein